jgi:hypothetical protein
MSATMSATMSLLSPYNDKTFAPPNSDRYDEKWVDRKGREYIAVVGDRLIELHDSLEFRIDHDQLVFDIRIPRQVTTKSEREVGFPEEYAVVLLSKIEDRSEKARLRKLKRNEENMFRLTVELLTKNWVQYAKDRGMPMHQDANLIRTLAANRMTRYMVVKSPHIEYSLQVNHVFNYTHGRRGQMKANIDGNIGSVNVGTCIMTLQASGIGSFKVNDGLAANIGAFIPMDTLQRFPVILVLGESFAEKYENRKVVNNSRLVKKIQSIDKEVSNSKSPRSKRRRVKLENETEQSDVTHSRLRNELLQAQLELRMEFSKKFLT